MPEGPLCLRLCGIRLCYCDLGDLQSTKLEEWKWIVMSKRQKMIWSSRTWTDNIKRWLRDLNFRFECMRNSPLTSRDGVHGLLLHCYASCTRWFSSSPPSFNGLLDYSSQRMLKYQSLACKWALYWWRCLAVALRRVCSSRDPGFGEDNVRERTRFGPGE